MTEIVLPKEKPTGREIIRVLPEVLRFIYRVDPKRVISLLLAHLLNTPLTVLSVISVKNLTDGLTAMDPKRVWPWIGVLLFASFVLLLESLIQHQLTDLLRYKVQVALSERWLKHMTTLPYRILEDPRFQSLAQVFDRKSPMITGVTMSLVWIASLLFEIIGLMSVFYYLPLIATGVFILAQIVRIYFMQRAREWSWEVMNMESREGKRAYYYQSVLTRLPTLLESKAYGFGSVFFKRWKKLAERLLEARMSTVRSSSYTYFFGDSIQLVGLGIGLLLIILSVLRGEIALSVVVVFITTFLGFQRAVSGLAMNITWFLTEAAFLPVFHAFFSVKGEMDRGKLLPTGILTIECRNVWFRYPNSEQDVLKGITFTFNQGDHLALVGLNGAGKSTLLKLLMRIYEPTQGMILVNGVDLRLVKPSEWRKALAVLTQNVQTYDDVLSQQIYYGDIERPTNERRLKRALFASGLEEVIQEMPKGVETHVGKQYAMEEDQAIELSGGQNQLLAIARTLYRDARIYIFDEPTAAVDAEKEERFFDQLPDALQSKAVIFVSHRFSTLRRAQRILVLDQGKVIEDGTHEELIEKKGRYAELFALQAKSYQ